MLPIKRNVPGKKSSQNDTINMGKSFQRKPLNVFQIINLGTTQSNLQKTLLHRSIAEFTRCLPKRKKNNANFFLKTYASKEFVALNLPMQADSSLFKRKMANSAQFKIIEI